MKKKYYKPEIKAVKLVPEEAVLTGCKTEATGKSLGDDSGACKYKGDPCSEYGS